MAAATGASEGSVYDKLTTSQLKHLIAGGVAGGVSRTSVSPLERMKILYQVPTHTSRIALLTHSVVSLRSRWRVYKSSGGSMD